MTNENAQGKNVLFLYDLKNSDKKQLYMYMYKPYTFYGAWMGFNTADIRPSPFGLVTMAPAEVLTFFV